MVALLVILTFAVMLLIDHLLLRQPIVLAEEAGAVARPRRLSPVVAGFAVPDNVLYHPGHTWAVSETPELVRVGIDDFAAKIAGGVERIDIPTRGQWIRQGQRLIALRRDGRDIELVSPIEGTIVDINDAAVADPQIARKDPYGEGWLLEVHSPDAKTNFRNLLSGAVARRWMEEAALRLRALMPTPAGALAQEGGVAVDDVLAAIPESEWPKAVRELFLA